MNFFIISLGSNISPAVNLRRAVVLLQDRADVIQVASAWETRAVGSSGPNFYNTAALLRTECSPEQLKSEVLRPVENLLGRVRTADKYAPRTIDLDPIVNGQEVLEKRLWEYAYLAVPTAEILPGLVNPATGEHLARAAQRLMQTSFILPHPEVFLPQ